MVFMEITIFRSMKPSLIALSILCLAKVSALAGVDLGTPSAGTPYESHMQPVKVVLQALSSQTAPMERAQELMRIGRSFRYSYTDPYTPAMPSLTAAKRAGDCKAKALWIADKLGDENVRFVIGKAVASSKISHAWVMWKSEGRWWILDPTNVSRPLSADTMSSNRYIPLYSYDKTGAYRHAKTGAYAAIASARAVAARGSR